MLTNQRNTWLLRMGFAACVGLTTLPALAVEPRAEMKLVQVGEVQYMSGGNNKNQRSVLDDHASDFHVRVNFVGKASSEQLRHVSVTLTKQGEPKSMIRLETAGPILLMSLPAGHYNLSATVPGSAPVQSQFDREPGKIEELRVVL
jgi:hypothetical protein